MFPKFSGFTKKVSELEDKPTLSASELKAYFDQSPEELRIAFDALIDHLASKEVGNSGADHIGVTAIATSPNKLQGVLEWMKTQIDNVSLGQIPDGAITAAKLADSAKQASNITVVDQSNIFAASDLEGVLKELFTNANNGKSDIAGVIGSPATSAGSFGDLKNVIQNVKNKAATNLMAKGTSASGAESLDSLITKISNVSTGRKFATGNTRPVVNFSDIRIIINGLSFRPKVVYAVLVRSNPYANANWYNSAMIDTSVFPLGSGIQLVNTGNQTTYGTFGYEFRNDGFTLPVAVDDYYTWIAIE